LGAVPRTLVWDGEGAIGRWRSGRIELTDDCQAFRGVLGAKVVVLKPAEPERKGIIERAHDYLERSFLPGRSFSGPGDFNHQLQQWLLIVNRRTRRVLGCAPTDRIGADRQAMLTLPPVPPTVGWRHTTRLARDHYIRLDSTDYSVHPGVIGRRIEVVADLDRVRVFCDGKTVADHERVWAWYQTITDPEHRAAANMLRRNRIGALRPVHESQDQISVEQRNMTPSFARNGVSGHAGAVQSDASPQLDGRFPTFATAVPRCFGHTLDAICDLHVEIEATAPRSESNRSA
jgi:hypothetical protein